MSIYDEVAADLGNDPLAEGEARDAKIPWPDGTRVRFPFVHCRLADEDGNAFAIIGRVLRAMQKCGVSRVEREAFRTEAMSGDYDHLLSTVMHWVSTDNDPGNDYADEGERYDDKW